MNNYVLSCCSTADLSPEHFQCRDLHYVCFHYFINGTEYKDDPQRSMTMDEFYQHMADGAEVRTSQVNISEYLDHFTPFLEQGKDILHVTLSTGISGSYNSAVSAAAIARERYPERKVYVVDSLGASSGYGLLMDKLADLRDEGRSIEEVRCWAEDNRLRLNHWFFSSDLTYYIKGGRISKAAGIFGGLLNICPLLDMDGLGRLTPREKIRTKKRVIRCIVDKMIQNADGGTAYDGKCYISMSACPGDAREVADLVEETFPNLNGKVLINDVGTTIGSHTGPGTLALFFWGKDRAKAE